MPDLSPKALIEGPPDLSGIHAGETHALAVPTKSVPARIVARRITASIAGIGTPAARPSALIGIIPTGTSSAMYLWVQELGVPVAWYGPSLLVLSKRQVSDRSAPRTP